VVDVAEHRHHRRPRHQHRLGRLLEEGIAPPGRVRERRRTRGSVAGDGQGRGIRVDRVEPEVVGGERGRVEVERLVQGRHDTVLEEVLDHLGALHPQGVGQLLHGQRDRQRDLLLHRGDDITSWVLCASIEAARASASTRSGVVRKALTRARRRRATARHVAAVSAQR
jgi:hypothetical protein